MRKIIAALIGALLAVIGLVALAGALEVARGGGSVEADAQSFLVPVSLFIFAVFVFWMGFRSGK